MSYLVITGIAIALAMDSFAVSISYGCRNENISGKDSFTIAIFFAFFQAFMALAGWYGGSLFSSFLNSYSHWAAFLILLYIGIRMIHEGLKPETQENSCDDEFYLSYKRLLLLSLATSIDALAVGMTLAFIEYPIEGPAAVIGAVTFIFSYAGVRMGCRLKSLFGKKSEILGGIILILIGLKIVMEHYS